MSDALEQIELSDGKPHPGRTMAEEEFVAWCDEDTRAEWVNGETIMMSPANKQHVDLNVWLLRVLGVYAEYKDLGTVLGPEYQVRLSEQGRRRVPDVLFVAKNRLDILHSNHVEGAPDFAMEIVSPDSGARDWREKYLEYEAAGVREYWIIDPMAQHAEVYVLTDKQNYRRVEEKKGVLVSAVLSGFYLKSAWLWEDTRPKVLAVLRELGVLG